MANFDIAPQTKLGGARFRPEEECDVGRARALCNALSNAAYVSSREAAMVSRNSGEVNVIKGSNVREIVNHVTEDMSQQKKQNSRHQPI